MSLGALQSLRYRDITNTPRVQKRIQLAQRVARRVLRQLKPPVFFPKNLRVAEEIRSQVTERDMGKAGVYCCFGGDTLTFRFATGLADFVGYDLQPFLNESGDQVLEGGAYGRSSEEALHQAAFDRLSDGYYHNDWIDGFQEIGILTIFDILASGGHDLRVFQAVDAPDVHKVVYRWGRAPQIFNVFHVQERLEHGRLPRYLSSMRVGCLLVKGAKVRAASETEENRTYRAVESLAGFSQLEQALFISDEPLQSPRLDGEQFTVSESLRRISFGYGGLGITSSSGDAQWEMLGGRRELPSRARVFLYRAGVG